jgi:class II flagellar assembly regulator FliX
MKVAGNSRVQTPATRKASAKSGAGSGFSVASATVSTSSESTAGISNASPVVTVDALLAIQEVPNEREGKRQAVKYGREMLDILDEVRMGILSGAVPKNRLTQLVKLVENRRDKFVDPKLADVLDEIELRARVELAKLANITT